MGSNDRDDNMRTTTRTLNLTPEQKAEELALYEAGASCRDIASALNRPSSSVAHRIRRAGKARPQTEAVVMAFRQGKKVKATLENAAKARKLIDKGVMKKDVCEKLGISQFTLRNIEKGRTLTVVKPKPQPSDTRTPYELFKKMRDQQPCL